jgi:hypothetical protein
VFLPHGQHCGAGDEPHEPARFKPGFDEGRVSDAPQGVRATDDLKREEARIGDRSARMATER